MNVTKSFNKLAPVAEASVFRIFGVNSAGYAVFLENQDESGGNTIVYTFQESNNGSTWTDITFTVSDEDQTDFTILPQATHLLKVSSSMPYIRMTAYGDAPLAITVSYHKVSDVDTAEVQLFEAA
jgi:hypothetical protein